MKKNITIIIMAVLIMIFILLDLISIAIFLRSSKWIFFALVVLSLIGIIAMIIFIVRSLDKSTVDKGLMEEKMNLQKAHYAALEQEQKEITRMRSEMKDSILKITEYLDENKSSDVMKYTQGIIEDYEENLWIEMCNIRLVDAVLHSKLSVCAQHNIHLYANVYIPEETEVPEKDWITLFHNLMNNAIESCMRCNGDRREIFINTIVKGNILFLKMENTKAEIKGKTWKKDKRNHGLGLSIIREVILRNNGTFVVDDTGENYVVTASFTIKQ